MTKPIQIKDVKAYPSSFPLSADSAVTLGIGRTVKRDAVIIKVVTEDGLIGFGESHHGRCPGAVAHLVPDGVPQVAMELPAGPVVLADKLGVFDELGIGLALSRVDLGRPSAARLLDEAVDA